MTLIIGSKRERSDPSSDDPPFPLNSFLFLKYFLISLYLDDAELTNEHGPYLP
ncbi:hypothetical protein COLO4_19921 [Corchorus olitorius]|uniref:Uncharacterized protein n=1 Tax=Corchorus olitorius TaxID=93759 RepID=A0A1R3J2R4_9ROSI|nr:hypothetical protein COLO4_19921 [Corchorus olitorius]